MKKTQPDILDLADASVSLEALEQGEEELFSPEERWKVNGRRVIAPNEFLAAYYWALGEDSIRGRDHALGVVREVVAHSAASPDPITFRVVYRSTLDDYQIMRKMTPQRVGEAHVAFAQRRRALVHRCEMCQRDMRLTEGIDATYALYEDKEGSIYCPQGHRLCHLDDEIVPPPDADQKKHFLPPGRMHNTRPSGLFVSYAEPTPRQVELGEHFDAYAPGDWSELLRTRGVGMLYVVVNEGPPGDILYVPKAWKKITLHDPDGVREFYNHDLEKDP